MPPVLKPKPKGVPLLLIADSSDCICGMALLGVTMLGVGGGELLLCGAPSWLPAASSDATDVMLVAVPGGVAAASALRLLRRACSAKSCKGQRCWLDAVGACAYCCMQLAYSADTRLAMIKERIACMAPPVTGMIFWDKQGR